MNNKIAIPNKFCDYTFEEGERNLYSIDPISVMYYYILCINESNKDLTRIRIIDMIEDCYYKKPEKLLEKVKIALNDLIEKNYIEVFDSNKKTINPNKLKLREIFLFAIRKIENKFILVDVNTTQAILKNIRESRIRANILKYYFLLYRRTDRMIIKDVPMIQEITKIQAYEIAELPPNSYHQTNKLFEEMGLFFFENKFVRENNKRISTHFVRTDQYTQEEFNKEMNYKAYSEHWSRLYINKINNMISNAKNDNKEWMFNDIDEEFQF